MENVHSPPPIIQVFFIHWVPNTFFFPQEFLRVYENFVEKISDIDRRMATIICQGFDDCSGLEATFKVHFTDI